MGIIDTLFGKRKTYSPLDPTGVAAARIAACRARLEPFVRKVHVPLELVPGATAVYVFLGNPPADFGMAWFENGREVSLTSLKEDQGLSQGRIKTLLAQVEAAYEQGAGETRYATTIVGKQLLVIPSESLAAAISKAIDAAVS